MSAELTDFSASQQQALFELLILSAHADGHLTTVEDGQLRELLMEMGFAEKADREREFAAAVTRLHPAVETIWKAKQQALALANAFTARKQQKQVFAAVEQTMAADQHVSSWENALLMELRMKFRL